MRHEMAPKKPVLRGANFRGLQHLDPYGSGGNAKRFRDDTGTQLGQCPQVEVGQ